MKVSMGMGLRRVMRKRVRRVERVADKWKMGMVGDNGYEGYWRSDGMHGGMGVWGAYDIISGMGNGI